MFKYKIGWIALLVCLAACQQSMPSMPGGADWHYYVDTKLLMSNTIIDHGIQIKRFVETTTHEKGKIDSAFLAGNMVNWKVYLAAMEAINLYDSTKNGNYKMSQNIDTNTKEVQIDYDPLYTNLPVQKMVVKMDINGKVVKSMYAVEEKKGAFSTLHRTVYYQPAVHLQIVESKEGIFSNKQKTARDLYFIKSTEPTVEIQMGN
jgi:hypothetical protein